MPLDDGLDPAGKAVRHTYKGYHAVGIGRDGLPGWDGPLVPIAPAGLTAAYLLLVGHDVASLLRAVYFRAGRDYYKSARTTSLVHIPEEVLEQWEAKTVYQAAAAAADSRDNPLTSPRCLAIQDAGERAVAAGGDVSATCEATARDRAPAAAAGDDAGGGDGAAVAAAGVDASVKNGGAMIDSESVRRRPGIDLRCGVSRPSRTASIHRNTTDEPRVRLSHKGRTRGCR